MLWRRRHSSLKRRLPHDQMTWRYLTRENWLGAKGQKVGTTVKRSYSGFGRRRRYRPAKEKGGRKYFSGATSGEKRK